MTKLEIYAEHKFLSLTACAMHIVIMVNMVYVYTVLPLLVATLKTVHSL